MDEVDRIIIQSLKSIGCELDDEVTSLTSFTADMIYKAVLGCVDAIKGTTCDVPRKLPPGMSQKFRAGSSLAALVMEIGYKGEVGYQTFLYSNEADIRKILMFLVDKLPRMTSGAGDETSDGSGTGAQLRSWIRSKIQSELKQVWLPAVCCQDKYASHSFRGHELLSANLLAEGRKVPKDMKRYYDTNLPDIASQAAHPAVLCSALIENNALQLISDQNSQWRLHAPKQAKSKSERTEEIKQKLLEEREAVIKENVEKTLHGGDKSESRFTQLERLQHTQNDMKLGSSSEGKSADSEETESAAAASSEEEVKKKQEEEVESLKSELQEVTNRIAKLTKNMEKARTAKEQTEKDIEEKNKSVEEKKKTYQVKKKTLDVLPESERTMAKIQQVIEGADERMKTLENQWVEHKTPLLQQIEQLRIQANNRQATIEQKLAELQEFKQQMKSSSDEARKKDELIKSLTTEYSSMSRELSRSSYTKRIIEIVSNIKKQKHDIGKVLTDTRAVQKEINMLTGKLDRQFTVTDELIFKDARKDESVRAAYKYLASLHDNCSAVRGTIEETGHILREIRQLEDQIEQEERNDSASNLDKIIADYKQMRKENQQLLAKLKQ